MARVSQMQGVPAHLTCLKAKDRRRHPSYCIFAEGKTKSRICTCPQSEMYMQHCTTSVRCDYYEEKEKEK